MTIKVAINGYGTIGKRVADAVRAQDDMKIVGVTKTRPTFEATMAINKGYPLYVASNVHIAAFEADGFPVKGTLDDLLKEIDIVIDCTPEKIGALNKTLYDKAGVKAIFQGGEKHEVAGISFNALANYEKAYGAKFVRVVSCNTTGLCRSLYPLDQNFELEEVFAVIVRRGADPWETKKGPINAIIPSLKLPTHHGPDVQKVIPHLKIETAAVKVPTTIMHLHSNIARFKNPVKIDDILDVWQRTPRIKFVTETEGIDATSKVMELARDLGRGRGDMYENVIWRDGAHVVDNTLYFSQAIHQESIVIPENIDAIRAMCELEKSKMKSIEKTNKALGIS